MYSQRQVHFSTKQRGFNLIEILVVLVIMGLLISIVAPSLLGTADKARIQKVFADFKQIETDTSWGEQYVIAGFGYFIGYLHRFAHKLRFNNNIYHISKSI